MRLTLEEKMKMCEEHIIKGKSISHASEMYGGYDIGNLIYLINVYKRFGKVESMYSIIKTKRCNSCLAHNELMQKRNLNLVK